jgi:hypothetical protein
LKRLVDALLLVATVLAAGGVMALWFLAAGALLR